MVRMTIVFDYSTDVKLMQSWMWEHIKRFLMSAKVISFRIENM